MTSYHGLRVGRCGGPQDTTQRQSLDNNVIGVPAKYLYPPQEGVALVPFQFYTVVPKTIVANNIATSQTPTGASNLTLTAGTNNTSVTLNGATVVELDCSRCISITGVGGTVQRNYTITGYDDYEQLMTCRFAGPSGAAVATSTKAFRYVLSIAVDGATTAAITVGVSDTLGLPYFVDAFEDCTINYAGAVITANTGFTAGVTTNPSTNATGDVRGTYALQSASNSVNKFSIFIPMPNVDTVTQVWGVAQSIT